MPAISHSKCPDHVSAVISGNESSVSDKISTVNSIISSVSSSKTSSVSSDSSIDSGTNRPRLIMLA